MPRWCVSSASCLSAQLLALPNTWLCSQVLAGCRSEDVKAAGSSCGSGHAHILRFPLWLSLWQHWCSVSAVHCCDGTIWTLTVHKKRCMGISLPDEEGFKIGTLAHNCGQTVLASPGGELLL
mmetsp:Transcript_5393/g.11880  ORF Transcript_5393/g.11880 Transcript_5393/m.11880 type:complete len:122 (+) Transcript_5393:1842-2207(+)